jgi:putative tryptophan/tyrosine transport system substrate-binding protein
MLDLGRRQLLTLLGGAVLTLPLTARGQEAAPAVGYLTGGRLLEGDVLAFKRGLNESGYIEGHNVIVEYRSAEGRHDSLPGSDLVRRQVSVLECPIGQCDAIAARRYISPATSRG